MDEIEIYGEDVICGGDCECGGALEYEEAIGGYVCVECEAEHFD